MSSAATPQPTRPTTPPAAPDRPSRAAHLLDLVHRLIDYAKDLAATFQQHGVTTGLADYARNFGTADIALILARITSGLLRAQALEARLVRGAGRLDAEPRPKLPASPRTPRAAPAARPAGDDPGLVRLPTPEWIAAEVRGRPIGAVIADICRDLGIMPNHPLWRELSLVIIRHGGNLATLFKDICRRLYPPSRPATAPAPGPALPVPRLATSCTGPP